MSTLTNTPLPIPEGLMRCLVAAYASPPRAYHSFTHVQEVIKHFHDVAQRPGWQHPKEVFLAILFHDAVYVAGRSDNEVKSADLALEACSTFLARESLDTARIRTLIELTAKHGKLQREDLDEETRLFLDCDMAILGSAPATFDAYDAAIEQEYSTIPKLVFRLNRNKFLQKLLETPRIFLSDHFHARLDGAARENLRRALK
ncbi:MAG: hypothetical protein QM817_21015 [Archangium sp.]